MYKTKNAPENKKLIQAINSGLIDLNRKIKKMSQNEIEIENQYEILDTAIKILDFNSQNQEGQGLKILTPAEQILIRLPISLAQLKTGI